MYMYMGICIVINHHKAINYSCAYLMLCLQVCLIVSGINLVFFSERD